MTIGFGMFKVIFSRHAVSQMFERGISVEDIEKTITDGEIIEAYSDDKPYPSRLMFYKLGNRPIHAVVAENLQDQEFIVVTAYEPNLTLWDSEFRKRKIK
jgi:hypothetical protein